MNSCFFCYFSKMPAIVAEQMITAAFQEISHRPLILGQVAPVRIIQLVYWDRTVVDHETIKVAIEIIIKKRNLRSIGRNVEAILCSRLSEAEVMIIYIK